jgi:predicted regulator of Ras-like GTPase activity (Roadblock/LC7/MglB family)
MRSPVRPLALAAALAASLACAPALRAQGAGGTPPAGSATSGTPSGSHGNMDHGATSQAGQPAAGGSSELVAQLDSVNGAAKAGLTSLPATVAVPLLRSLETKLQGTRNASLRSIARDLAALRGELEQSEVSGARVGTILRRVGPKVTTVARSQSGATRATLQSIGRELTAAGRQLRAGAARPAE